MQIRLACDLQSDSIVDGEGIRTVMWTQGCLHRCPGCHNEHTHDYNAGSLYEVDEIIQRVKNLNIQDGITISGGEPFSQAKACAEIAHEVKKAGLNVWCYTGYTFEELLELSIKNQDILDLLNNIDILVDGKFILEKKSLNILFRGSTNQRILNVKRSLKLGKASLVQKYKISKPKIEKKSYIFV